MSLIYFENLYINFQMQIYDILGFNKSLIDYFDAFYNQ
jgi:hypothetical protein